MKNKLSYKNEEDKAYGATGMAMAVVIFDGEDKLSGINLDAEPDAVMQFTDEFYFNGNPGFSAKSSWNQMLGNFNLAMALSLGNVICRSVSYRSEQIDNKMKAFLRDLMIEEGSANCGLEEDETGHLFEKNYSYLTRAFNHYGVQSVARDFADTLRQRRQMTRLDILESLRALTAL